MKKTSKKGVIMLDVRAVLTNRNGKVIKRTRWKRSESFAIQFLEFLYCNMGQVTYNITTIANVEDPWSSGAAGRLTGATGDINKGIVVGTGTTTPTNTDYALVAQITHGTGSGQLLYGTQAFLAPTVIGGNVDWVLTRSFTNNSGATITVKEVGIYMEEGTTAVYRLMARDLLTVVVTNGLTVTIEYRLRTTV